MSEMSRADAELVYKHLNDRVRADVETEAYNAALDEFEELDALETANESSESEFSWEGLYYEFQRGNLDRDELMPVTGVNGDYEPEVDELAREFGWLVIENIRDKIREMQEESMFSSREFVALVLDAKWDERTAASKMDVSVGNYRGKKGTIANKLETAKMTIQLADQIRGE